MTSAYQIKIFPLLHINYIELLGYDRNKITRETEITLLKNEKLYIINEENELKVWDLEKIRIIDRKDYNDIFDAKSYESKHYLCQQ